MPSAARELLDQVMVEISIGYPRTQNRRAVLYPAHNRTTEHQEKRKLRTGPPLVDVTREYGKVFGRPPP